MGLPAYSANNSHRLRTLPTLSVGGLPLKIIQSHNTPALRHSGPCSGLVLDQYTVNGCAHLLQLLPCNSLQFNVHPTLPLAIASQASLIADCPALYINPPRPITGSSHSLTMAALTRSVHG